MVQETPSPLVMHGRADDLLVSREGNEFLEDDNMWYSKYLKVQKMVYSAIRRYNENNLRWLADGVIRSTMEGLLQTSAKEPTKRLLISNYGDVETIIKHVVRCQRSRQS